MRSRAWVLAVALGGGGEAGAQPPGGAALPLLPDSRLTIQGTSNVNPFTCRFEVMSGSLELMPAAAGGDKLPEPAEVAGVQVRVPAPEMRCLNDQMDSRGREALKAAEHPEIHFRLQALEPGERKKGKLHVVARGELTLAGQTRPVSVPAAVERKKDQLHVTGTLPVLLSEWGIERPTELYGSLRVDDLVQVGFDLRFAARERR